MPESRLPRIIAIVLALLVAVTLLDALYVKFFIAGPTKKVPAAEKAIPHILPAKTLATSLPDLRGAVVRRFLFRFEDGSIQQRIALGEILNLTSFIHEKLLPVDHPNRPILPTELSVERQGE